MPTSSRGLLGIMKMCSLCRLCGVARALCPARPGPARLTPSDPRNHRIAESPNRQGAHSDRIANREALQRDSARFNQPQDWQGRGGSPTSAPRPATPGEISDPRPATPSDPGRPAQPGSQRLTYIVWVINARSLVTSIKFVIGCLCTLLLPSDAMLCHCFTVYP